MVIKISQGTVHTVPPDLKAMLTSSPKITDLWNSFTPLARNEWICWVTSGKLAETRTKRIRVGKDKILKGMRRPCCWAGCPHREKTKE